MFYSKNPRGGKSATVKNAAGQTRRVVDYDGSDTYTTHYNYDTQGNMVQETLPDGSHATLAYNVKNQLTSRKSYDWTGTLSLETTYEYNDAGNMTKMADYTFSGATRMPKRVELTEYDGLQRKTSFAQVDGTDQPTTAQLAKAKVTYEYDNENRLIRTAYPKTNGLKALSFVYNEFGWLTEVKGNIWYVGEKTLRSYTYNDQGNIEKITDSLDYLSGGDRKLVKSYEYDSLNRVTKMGYADSKVTGSNGSPVEKESFSYEYDKNSQITKETWINNWPTASSDQRQQTTTYTYDNLNQMRESKEILTKGTSTSQTTTTQYEYDATGNRTKQTVNGTVTTYTYNLLDRLRQSQTGSQMITYTYDENGNQVQEYDSQTQTTTKYAYDAENRLSKVSKKTGSTEKMLEENAYNGNGQRIQKKTYELSLGYCKEDVKYYYEGSSVLYATTNAAAGMDGAGVTYVYGAGSNTMLAEENNGSGTLLAYGSTKDIKGSTKDLIATDGQRMATYSYKDFGETSVEGSWGGSVKNEILYTGGIYDKDTKEYYLNARYYDPSNGRFLTQDTYRGEQKSRGTWNLYSYCAGNPINYIDPSGHKAANLEKEFNLPKSNSSSPLKISIKKNKVEILWYAKFYGDIDAKVAEKGGAIGTYRGMVKGGIQKRWSGDYYVKGFNAKVSVKIMDGNNGPVITTPTQKYTSVNFTKKIDRSYVTPDASGWSRNSPGKMQLYYGQKGWGVFSANLMQIVSAHEFGHILGIGDGYNDNKTKYYNSIMCDEYGIRNNISHSDRKATDLDIGKALDAFKSNKKQHWR